MPIPAILAARLLNQQIAQCAFTKPAEIVEYLGAMQAQDFSMAKWAIGMRVPGLHDADVEQAFNSGQILRTHVLRPTWHFVSPADIRWMIELTAPRVNAVSAYYYRATELDAKVFKKTNAVITTALKGGHYLTRTNLQKALQKAKIKAEGVRLSYIMMRAELDAVICSGPRQGKQFTYALLNERAPDTVKLHRQEALVALAKKYFTSRGPATANDYATWSGLAMLDVKESISLLGKQLATDSINNKVYFFASSIQLQAARLTAKHQTTFLLPDYDEYTIGYKDRTEMFGERKGNSNTKVENPVFYHSLIVDGVAAGTWLKAAGKGEAGVEIKPTIALNKTKQHAVAKAIKKYLAFVS